MSDEIPAIAVVEGYRKALAEATEENIILKWQISQERERVQQLVEALGKVTDLQEDDPVGST